MCFSATASFVASGVLVTSGFISLRLAKKSERLLALVPILFAIQQAIEGVQWLVFHPSLLSQILGYIYLFFAFILWPIYIPMAVAQVEVQARSKNILQLLAKLGKIVSFAVALLLILYPLSVEFAAHHLTYLLPISLPIFFIVIFFYTLAVVGSLIASSWPTLRFVGVLVFLAEVVAAIFYFNSFASIWCYLSSIIVAGLVWHFYTRR